MTRLWCSRLIYYWGVSNLMNVFISVWFFSCLYVFYTEKTSTHDSKTIFSNTDYLFRLSFSKIARGKLLQSGHTSDRLIMSENNKENRNFISAYIILAKKRNNPVISWQTWNFKKYLSNLLNPADNYQKLVDLTVK